MLTIFGYSEKLARQAWEHGKVLSVAGHTGKTPAVIIRWRLV
jgi:hypothetical protein